MITTFVRQQTWIRFVHALIARLARSAATDRRMRAVLGYATRRWRHREHVIWRGPGAGLRINLCGSRPSYVFGIAEPGTQRLLSSWLRPGAVFYDLAANVGFFSLIASRPVGPEGHVYAIEPSPAAASALKANVVRNGLGNVTVIEAAAGRENGSGRLDTVDGGVSQSAHLLLHGDSGGLEVRIVAIDALVREGARPPDVVKIDVEGAEEDAIVGMGATLAAHRPSVVCEIHQTLHAHEHPVEALLRRAGLVLSWLEPGMSREAVLWAPHLVAVAPHRPVAG